VMDRTPSRGSTSVPGNASERVDAPGPISPLRRPRRPGPLPIEAQLAQLHPEAGGLLLHDHELCYPDAADRDRLLQRDPLHRDSIECPQARPHAGGGPCQEFAFPALDRRVDLYNRGPLSSVKSTPTPT